MQEDVGALYASRDPEEYGRARLSHVADTWKGKLDPAEYLNPGRHGEWTSASGLCPAHNPGAFIHNHNCSHTQNHTLTHAHDHSHIHTSKSYHSHTHNRNHTHQYNAILR